MTPIESRPRGTIGIVGNPERVRKFIKPLADRRFNPIAFRNIEEVNTLQHASHPDLIIVNEKVIIPEGMQEIPIIVTGNGRRGAATRALNNGAINYIPRREIDTEGIKIHTREEVANYTAAWIDRLFKRTREVSLEPTITLGDISIDPNLNCLKIKGEKIYMEPQTVIFIMRLIQKRDKLVTKTELRQTLLINEKKCPYTTDLRLEVYQARKALREYGRHIRTIHGEGYMFKTELPS